MKFQGSLVIGARVDLYIAYLAAAAVAAHVLESAFPGPGPWFKVGLANIFVLVAFFLLGWRAAVAVSLIRVFTASLMLGTFLSPTFILSLSGALGAVLAMGALRLLRLPLGPVGISIISSMAHMVVQVVVAYLIIVGHPGIFLALPWLLAGSWLSGILNGVVAFRLLEQMEKTLLVRGGVEL